MIKKLRKFLRLIYYNSDSPQEPEQGGCLESTIKTEEDEMILVKIKETHSKAEPVRVSQYYSRSSLPNYPLNRNTRAKFHSDNTSLAWLGGGGRRSIGLHSQSLGGGRAHRYSGIGSLSRGPVIKPGTYLVNRAIGKCGI